MLVSSLAAAAAATADGDGADTPDADVVDSDNNGRSLLSFEGTNRSMTSCAFATCSGLV